MRTEKHVQTVTIEGTEYQLRPPTDDSYADQEAWLEGDHVVEFSDEDDGGSAETDDPIRTYGIKAVANIIDAGGNVVGFICPSCERTVLLDAADIYHDGYRGCVACGCDVVVACGDVISS